MSSQLELSSARVFGLTCEYISDPVGIDVTIPRFSWKIRDDLNSRGQRQTAYHILVGSSVSILNEGNGDFWDSGFVQSSQSVLVPFAGRDLVSGTEYFWKVRILDKNGNPSNWSDVSRFSMGLLLSSDWKGPWIKHPTATSSKHIWFRKTFSVEQMITSAFVHVASIGYHELYINGKKADDRVLSPALTRLDKRVHYVTYDLTEKLNPNTNCIGIWLAAGWSRYELFRTEPALRVQLNVKLASGDAISVPSDSSWRCEISNSEDTGMRHHSDHGGEKIDARKYIPNWNSLDYNDDKWSIASLSNVNPNLSAQMVEPSRIVEIIRAKEISGKGQYLIDFGKNFTGWISLTMRNQSSGDVVTIQTSDNPNTVQAFGQSSSYICSGQSEENFQNRFNYVCGRYCTVSGLATQPDFSDFVGYAISTDLKRVGYFFCSNEFYNKIYETDLWTYRMNTVEGYTEDCPHRERLGYGEVQFATAWGCGIPNYDAGALYTKIVRDWRDVQLENGWIHHTAPQISTDYGGPMWSSAPLNISWELYRNYGDRRILEESYQISKSWLDFLNTNVHDGILQQYNSHYNHGGNFLGDWAAPYEKNDPLKGKEFGDTQEALLFNNCVYAMNLSTFSEIAETLGKTNDANTYRNRLKKVREMIHLKFFDPSRNLYLDTRQIHLAFPLFVGVTPDEVKSRVLANFEKEILEERAYLEMGSSGLPVLLKFLIEGIERNDIISLLLSKTDEPSYGYFLSRGETTWPEYWDDNCVSRIHTCYTGIASWFMKGLAGIREGSRYGGYQTFLIKPEIASGLTFVEAKTDSLYGTIAIRWERMREEIRLSLAIPCNSSSTLYLPTESVEQITESGMSLGSAKGVTLLGTYNGRVMLKVESGSYRFVSKFAGG